MKLIFLFAVLALTIHSCKKTPETAVVTENKTETIINDSLAENLPESSIEIKEEKTAQVEEIQLGTFGFPAEVEGCSCYFAKNKADFENQKYIYVDDYGKNAFIIANGNQIRFPMKDGNFNEEHFSRKLNNSTFKVELNGEKIKSMHEVIMFEGTMTVENLKTGAKTTSPIYGECGC